MCSLERWTGRWSHTWHLCQVFLRPENPLLKAESSFGGWPSSFQSRMLGGQGVIGRQVSQAPAGWQGLEGGRGEARAGRTRTGLGMMGYFSRLRFLVPGFWGSLLTLSLLSLQLRTHFHLSLKCQKFVWALAFSSSSLRCLTVQFCFVVKVVWWLDRRHCSRGSPGSWWGGPLSPTCGAALKPSGWKGSGLQQSWSPRKGTCAVFTAVPLPKPAWSSLAG